MAISYVGIWTFPPWWTRYLYGGLLVAAFVVAFIRRRNSARWPQRLMGWLHLIFFVAFAVYAVTVVRGALAATAKPSGGVVNLHSPFERGTYLVANGGSATSVNAHAIFLDQSIRTRRSYRGTGHGVDLVALDRWGLRADGVMPADPRSYISFGKPVVAPCKGDVILAVDGLPDMKVPVVDRSHLAGNHVLLRCAGADILLGHFRKGSVVVDLGQRLQPGDRIASVGNSGNTSEPYLHIHAQEPGTREAPFPVRQRL